MCSPTMLVKNSGLKDAKGPVDFREQLKEAENRKVDLTGSGSEALYHDHRTDAAISAENRYSYQQKPNS